MNQNKTAGRIAVIGSSNTDMVVMTSHFPAPGETILGGDFLMNAGGKGANQAVAASRAGGDVSFIGKTGDDMFGREARAHIKKEGIDVSCLFIDKDAPSGIAQIIVDEKGENCIVVAPGANLRLERADVDRSIGQLKKADILLMQLEIPMDTVLYAAEKARTLGKKVILNPAPAPAVSLPEELYSYLFLITPNETETELLTGIRVTDTSSASAAAEALRQKGVGNIIITMGSKGAFVFTGDFQGIIPSFMVKAVDTTAAGDCFNGVLAVKIAGGSSLPDAVRYANRAASIAVTRPGAQASMPHKNEIDNDPEKS